MYLNLKEIKWIPFCVIGVLLMRIAVSIHVFPGLQMYSYLILGSCIFFFLVYFFLYLYEKRITAFYSAIILFHAFLIPMTVINDGDHANALYMLVDNSLVILIFSYYERNIKFIVQSFAFLFSMIVYINLAIMILYPTWMLAGRDVTESFLLGGNYNQMGARFICAIVVSVLCVQYSKWWVLNTVLLFVVSISTLILVGSMTSTANIIVYGLFCLIPSLKLRKVAIASLFVVFILFQVLVVFNGEGIQHNEFAVYIIEDVLEKDITFTKRTFLWEGSMKLFSESPIVGYGVVKMEWYRANLSAMALGPHNFILAMMIHGGIVLLFTYCFICWIAIKRLLENFDSAASYILMGIAVMMFMMTMEVYPMSLVILMLSLAYFYKQIRDTFPNNNSIQELSLIENKSEKK